MNEFDDTFSKLVSDKVAVDFNVFGTLVENGIGGNGNGSLVVTKD